MAKITQSKNNPFKNTDTNKRYYTYDYYLRKTFGGKCAKITLDAGFSCPNIDGRCGVGGCIYCSSRGSGDFAEMPSLTIEEQYSIQCEKIRKKWDTNKFIPYLQAHTNTYAPIEKLRDIYRQVLSLPNKVGINIATRADCLPSDVLELLSEIAEKTTLTVELGLQSVHDKTADLINRGHYYSDFVDAFYRLRKASQKISICVHLIDGLPNETEQMMLDTAKEMARLHPDQIKFHLLHVLRGTVLGDMYEKGDYVPMSLEDYVSVICKQLELLPEDIVIGRITGDGKSDDLLAPEWSKKKLVVMNEIDKTLYKNDSFQGKFFN